MGGRAWQVLPNIFRMKNRLFTKLSTQWCMDLAAALRNRAVNLLLSEFQEMQYLINRLTKHWLFVAENCLPGYWNYGEKVMSWGDFFGVFLKPGQVVSNLRRHFIIWIVQRNRSIPCPWSQGASSGLKTVRHATRSVLTRPAFIWSQ